jgi:predicted nuclease with RNAse H fold
MSSQMNDHLHSSVCVIGIDVGGPRKGFHAVALKDGRYLAKHAHADASTIASWCKRMGAQVVGIDAPCRWSTTGRSRSTERALAAEGIYSFATPTQEAAQSKPFYRWMLNGAELYRLIEPRYPLFNGRNTAPGPVCFETFPQAVACALAGKIVSAKQKATVRRGLLSKAGMDTSELTNIDTVDAALCALTAHCFLMGNIKTYGEDTEGYIVVPGTRTAAGVGPG